MQLHKLQYNKQLSIDDIKINYNDAYINRH